MTECKYCKREIQKGVKMHERYCQKNPENTTKPQSLSDPGGAIFAIKSQPIVDPPPDDIISKKEEKKSKQINYYILLAIIFIIGGVVQYFTLYAWLKMHWIFLAASWVIDIIIYAFLCYTIWRLRKKQKPVVSNTIEDFIEKVPAWAIDKKSPKKGLVGSILNAGTDYIQLVLVSENFEPKKMWVEWDGYMFIIGDRAYIPPRDVRGDVFFYHVDKKTPLIDAAEIKENDAKDSFQLLAVRNESFELARLTLQNKYEKSMNMILIISAITLLCVLGLVIYQYGQFESINQKFVMAEKLINQIAAEYKVK